MKNLLLIIIGVFVIFSCKEKHEVQPNEIQFDNFAKVVRITSISKDSVYLKNNSGKTDTLSNVYLYRTSKSQELVAAFPDSIKNPVTKKGSPPFIPAVKTVIEHGKSIAFKSKFPINFSTDTVFLYLFKPGMSDTVLVDKFLPQANPLSF